jgi:hypothetical protein
MLRVSFAKNVCHRHFLPWIESKEKGIKEKNKVHTNACGVGSTQNKRSHTSSTPSLFVGSAPLQISTLNIFSV